MYRTIVDRSRAARTAAVILLLAASVSPAYAYVDPGTGSMLLQLGVAAVASMMFFFRHLRMQLRDWVRRVVLRRDTDGERDTSSRDQAG